MPKATLTFELPEEQEEYETANNAGKYYHVIWETLQELRKKIKYDDSLTDEQFAVYESVRESIFSLLSEEGIIDLF